MNTDELLAIDKADLTAILEMRFGTLPADVYRRIHEISRPEVAERYILVAANAASWDVMATELDAPEDSFRIVGEQYNPTASVKVSD